ncbi:MAG: M3 family metallopeptidase [Pseudomonadota bacterium]
MSHNPLLLDGLPAFGRIEPEHALPAVEQRLQTYQLLLDELAECQDFGQQPTPWIEREVLADDALAQCWSTIGHLHAVTNTDQWRAAYSACLEQITAFYTARGQNPHLFELWRAAAEHDDFTRQPREFQRMVQHELQDFRLSGIDLMEPERSRFAEISLELSSLGNAFGNRVLDATEAYSETFDHADALSGLPTSALDTLRNHAQAADLDGFRADLSYPCYHAIITYAHARSLRERFYRAHSTRASDQGPNAGQFDNSKTVVRMLQLRHEQAQLLGYRNAAEVKLVKRMADSAEQVIEFLTDLAKRARAPSQQQLAQLTEFAVAHGASAPLAAWDIAYWSERMRKDQIGLSQDALKDYFELERTLEAMFDLASRLFGLTIEHDPAVPCWHPDVRYYRIQSEHEASTSAGLYIDLYSRSRKQGGAWMDICRQRMHIGDQQRPPVAYLTCNFAAPTDGQPSLLPHNDVVTLFHEFGHCLHHLLSRVNWPSVSGISGVEWDAVELPSQLLEGWVWEPEFLNRFARHHATDEPIPADWVAAMNADRRFMGAITLTRQLSFALTDLTLHQQPELDPIDTMQRIHDQIAVTPLPEYNRFLMSFGHLFNGGYAAGYYSYLWAERLARDAFEVFREQGLWHRSTGQKISDEILSVGGSRPMAESWRAFRGQDARLQPLLAAYGVDG